MTHPWGIFGLIIAAHYTNAFAYLSSKSDFDLSLKQRSIRKLVISMSIYFKTSVVWLR